MNFIIGERWDWDGSAPCPSNYVIDYAREFWYDGARQRFLNREVDPVKLMNQDVIEALSETWSEYAASPGGGGDGNDIYGDFIITEDPTTVVVTTSYELGIGKTTDPLGSPATSYYHADRLGTTRLLSDPTGGGIDPTIYAAFGELESGTNHRFGYVGKDGYQAHPGAPGLALLHLGARYYDPALGRFLQRDPIGWVAWPSQAPPCR